MIKNKYGNEVAFAMGNILAAYQAPIDKKAQWLSNKNPETEETGGPVDLGHTVSDTIDESVDVGDPTNIPSRFEEASGRGFGDVGGEHASLLEQEDKLRGELGEGKELAYQEEMNKPTEMPGDSPVELKEEDFLQRENPFETDTAYVDMENPFKSPGELGGGKPADVGETPNLNEMDLLEYETPEPTPGEGLGEAVRSSLIMKRIQKIATYFGEKGDFRNEALADQLLNSVINDFTKK